MAGRKIMLDDLSGWAKEQVQRKLGLLSAQSTPKAVPVQSAGSNTDARKVAIRVKKREPNKTEAEYNRRQLGGLGKYEAVSLRLPGGSRYTPDWATVGEGGRITLHEVKGAYKFGSHGRAATAFRECVAAFPEFSFVWAVRNADGSWSVKESIGGQKNAVS